MGSGRMSHGIDGAKVRPGFEPRVEVLNPSGGPAGVGNDEVPSIFALDHLEESARWISLI